MMQNLTPPKLATEVLLWFLRDDFAEEVLGDLEEKFYATAERKSVLAARINYYYQVFNYVRPFAIRKRRKKSNQYAMYGNYFKTSIRSLRKGKMHATINLLGLTTGMTVAILLGLWLWDEISFNRYHKNYDRIAQVIQNVSNNGEIQTWNNVPFPLAEEIRKNYSEDFESVVMGTGIWEHSLELGDKKLYKQGTFFENGAANLLSLRIINGTGIDNDPSSILLSSQASQSIFGAENPIGKSLLIDGNLDVKVAGVYEDIPYNSDFAGLDFIASYDLYYSNNDWMKTMEDPWRPNFMNLYVQIKDNASFEGVSEKIRDAKLRKVNESLAKKKPVLFLQPMSKWRLFSEFQNGVNTGGRIRYVWLFGIIGVFVLAMACINFMNLSTARSERRSKEIGIRKAIGSLRGQLIGQFFTESILMAACSFIIAMTAVYLALPWFNQIADKKLSLFFNEPVFWGICVAFILITGLLAGSYPALYLSSIRSIQALKGTFKAGRNTVTQRKILVVLQFFISICMITGTLVVFQQIEYARLRPVGYNRDGLISVPVNTEEVRNHFEVVKNELRNKQVIVESATSEAPVTDTWASSSGFSWPGKDPDLSIDFKFTGVSYDFGKTINWQISDGRDFSSDFISDSSAMILNEAAVKYMGLEHPVGETIEWWDTPYTVVGVVKDVIVGSPYEPVSPHVYYITNDVNYFVLRINPELSTSEALTKIEATFKEHNPGEVFDFQFANDAYAQKFAGEERVGKLASMFSILAIFISCLGIFGLASFVAEQRTKEIGIRKVNGASIMVLWQLLTKDFVILVILSGIISIPASLYVITKWLQNYTYHTNPGWWIYLLSIGGTLLITVITASYHTIYAARINPVKCLRVE